MRGISLNSHRYSIRTRMRIPLLSQHTLPLLMMLSSYAMGANAISRASRPLSMLGNGRFLGSYSFICSKNVGTKTPVSFQTTKITEVRAYPDYNGSYTSVSTAYQPSFEPVTAVAPAFPQVPNYNYGVVPNQFGFSAPGPTMNPYNSYRPNSYSRPRRYNSYGSPFNRGYQRPYRNYTTASSYDIPVSNIDWDKEQLVEIKKDFYDLSYEADSRPGEEIEQILKDHAITIEGEHPLPKPVNTFDEAVFNEPIQKIIRDSNFAEPTPIQKVGWTSCLTGRDVVGISQTGSGKTLTFLLPGLLHLLAQPPVGSGGPIMLVLAPTRELCLQISEEAMPYARELNIRLSTVYGGTSRYGQVESFRNGTEIMVATPGRLLDFLSQGSLKLNRVSYFVMDEADRMLDMGFEPQIRKIAAQIRPDRQTLMFSATWPPEIKRLASEFCKPDFIYIQVGDLELTANPDITQKVQVMNSYEIRQNLFEFLDSLPPERKVLIFSDLKSFADQLANTLQYRRLRAASLHGGKSQAQRERILSMFRTGQYNILVATDVAARGLDIKDVDCVVNLDAPKSLLDYIHRIGRTARGGKKGESLLYFAKDTMNPGKVKFAQDLSNLLAKLNQNAPSELFEVARG